MNANKMLQSLRENNKTSYMVSEGLTVEYYKGSNKEIYEVLDSSVLFSRNTNNKNIGLTLSVNGNLIQDNIIYAYNN